MRRSSIGLWFSGVPLPHDLFYVACKVVDHEVVWDFSGILKFSSVVLSGIVVVLIQKEDGKVKDEDDKM